MDESSIIIACKKNDRKAQKGIFDRYADGMLLLCRRYVKDVSDAEEMMLNGFYKFFEYIDRFVYNGEHSIRVWLKKIMINECLMLMRQKGRLQFVAEEYGLNETKDAAILDQIYVAEIMKIIMALPDGYRTVFNLYVIEGFTHKDIAAMLNISEGTSKSQLSKARILLQKEMIKKGVHYERA